MDNLFRRKITPTAAIIWICAALLSLTSITHLLAKTDSQPKAECGMLEKSYTQKMILNVANAFNIPLDAAFEITLTYSIDHDVVRLHIPAFNFCVPGNIPGYVYTQDGFLPRKIWPNDPAYQSFFIGNDNEGDNFEVQVSNAGSLIFLATEGMFFSPGCHQIQATTITYFLTGSITDCNPPKNIQVSRETSNVVGTDVDTEISWDYLEFHQISFYDNKFAIWWPDNSENLSTNGRNHLSAVVRTGSLKQHRNKSKVVFDHSPRIAIDAPEGVFYLEGAITINPTNPNNMFLTSVAADFRNNNFPLAKAGNVSGQDNFTQQWSAVSFDGGDTWTATRRDGTPGFHKWPLDGLTPVFDKFGNLWVGSVAGINGNVVTSFLNNQGVPGVAITLGVSIDGGQTFTDLGTLPLPVAQTTQIINGMDYPKATFGGDGQGGFAYYLNTAYLLLNDDFQTGEVSKYLTYIPVQGFNNYGSVQSLQIPQTLVNQDNPLEINLFQSEIVASDEGKIMLFANGQSWNFAYPGTFLLSFVDTTGIVNFDAPNSTGEAFRGPYSAAKSNIGNLTNIPFQPARGINAWGYGLAYDPDTDRFYAAVVDEQPLGSGNFVLYLIFSEDDGQTWSKPVLIADSINQARGSINMHRDPVSGNILFAWQDARNQKNQENVNIYMAIMTKEELDRLPCCSSCH